MRRYLLLIAFALFAVAGYAQEIRVVGRVTANYNDTEARRNPKLDNNGRTAALIKIETTERGFSFENGLLGVVDVDYNHIGQVWVYLPPKGRGITLRHATYGSLYHEFGEPLKERVVYNMRIATTEPSQPTYKVELPKIPTYSPAQPAKQSSKSSSPSTKRPSTYHKSPHRTSHTSRYSDYRRAKYIGIGYYGVGEGATYGALLGYIFATKSKRASGMFGVYGKFMNDFGTNSSGMISTVNVGAIGYYKRWMFYTGVGGGRRAETDHSDVSWDVGVGARLKCLLLCVGYNSISVDKDSGKENSVGYHAFNVGFGFVF